MKTYEVRAVRSDKWWALFVEGASNIISQCRRLEQAEQMIRDAIRLMDGLSDDEFDVLIMPEAPGDLAGVIDDARRAQAAAAESTALASKSMREAARRLIDSDLTMRDAARLLGVSPQRVHQLVNS
jgi:RecA/RadA recombinase